MASLDEIISILDKIIADFDEHLKQVSQTAALDAIAIIIRRIQTEGIGKKYSTDKIPAYLLLLDESRLDTERTKKFVRSVAEREDPDDRYTNWAEVRRAHGNQADFVDLTFTGEMFRKTGITADAVKMGDYWVTTIGGLDKEAQDKLRWNAQRYGDFFMLTQEEYDLILGIINSKIEDFFIKKLQ